MPLRYGRAPAWAAALFVLLSPALWAQTQSCSQRGSFTLATTYASLANNTGNPICNAWVLAWWTSSPGFSAISIELQGSDNNSTWTTFSGTGTLVVGSNPASTLSGVIVVQASATNAYVRVNLVSATGSGTVSFQLTGNAGVNPTASSGGGGSGCSSLGGDLSGTCASAEVVGIHSHAITGVQGNGALAQLSTGSTTSGDCVEYDANGNTTDAGAPCGTLTTAITSLFGNMGPIITALLVPSGDSLGPSGTGTITATQVPTAASATATTNGQLKYDTTANNLHAANNGADAILPVTTVTPGNGNCVEWVNSSGLLKLADAGAACGSGGSGGGGVITYSSSADTLTGTQFLPPGGGAPLNSTESDVQVASPAAATVSNLHVQVSAALGTGNSAVFTWRDGGSSQTLTCTISGASATSCSDTTHSFNAAAGDLLDMQVVTTGVPGVVNVLFTSAFGTSNVGITSLFGNTGPSITSLNVPTGDSLNPTGTGTVTATQVPTASSATATTNGQIIYDTSNNNLHASQGSADAIVVTTPTATPTNGDCMQWVVSSGKVTAGTASGACGSGSSGAVTLLGSAVFTSGTTCTTGGTITVTCGSGGLTFSVIPGTYSGLVIRLLARSSNASDSDDIEIRFNGDTSTDYNNIGWFVNPASSGTTGGSGANAQGYIGTVAAASNTSGRANTLYVECYGYANTSFFKTLFSLMAGAYGATTGQLQSDTITVGWNSTSAITSVTVFTNSTSNFVTGSTFGVYGLQ